MKKSFEPLIKREKSTLQEKNVTISGIHDFDRETQFLPQKEDNISNHEPKKIVEEKKEKTIPEEFFKATKTAKLSPDVLLRLNTLKPFVEELEEIDKSTVNEMMHLLIESYVSTRLTNRQREGYNQMYQHLLEFNKK